MGKTIERINGIRVITFVFYGEDQRHEDGGVGYIDFVDDRFGKARHRFAYINAKDWEREIIVPHTPDGSLSNGGHKAIESQLGTIRNVLDEALMNNKKIDIVVERRQVTLKQQFDFLIKVDDDTAFSG